MRRVSILTIAVAAVILAAGSAAGLTVYSGTVQTTRGDTISGFIAESGADVVVKTPYGNLRIPVKDVKKVNKKAIGDAEYEAIVNTYVNVNAGFSLERPNSDWEFVDVAGLPYAEAAAYNKKFGAFFAVRSMADPIPGVELLESSFIPGDEGGDESKKNTEKLEEAVFPLLSATHKALERKSERYLDFKQIPAVRWEFESEDNEGESTTIKALILKRGGLLYMLQYLAPEREFATVARDITTLITGFSFLGDIDEYGTIQRDKGALCSLDNFLGWKLERTPGGFTLSAADGVRKALLSSLPIESGNKEPFKKLADNAIVDFREPLEDFQYKRDKAIAHGGLDGREYEFTFKEDGAARRAISRVFTLNNRIYRLVFVFDFVHLRMPSEIGLLASSFRVSTDYAAPANSARLSEAVALYSAAAGKFLKNKPESAQEDAEKALELCPKYAACRILIADICVKSKDFDAAARLYDEAGAFYPAVDAVTARRFGAYLGAAQVAFSEKNYKDAREAAEKALKLDPDDKTVKTLVGDSYIYEGLCYVYGTDGEEIDFKKGLKLIEKAFKMDKLNTVYRAQYISAWCVYTRAFIKEKEFSKAESEIKKMKKQFGDEKQIAAAEKYLETEKKKAQKKK